MDLRLNDRVELKKQHPCGNKIFIITRVGMDIKWRCEECGRGGHAAPQQGRKKHQTDFGRRGQG